MEIEAQIIKLFARNLKSERMRAGLSQAKLAERAGLSVRYISRLETNPQDLRIGMVAVLAHAMGLPAHRLLFQSGDRPLAPSSIDTLDEAIRLIESVKAARATDE